MVHDTVGDGQASVIEERRPSFYIPTSRRGPAVQATTLLIDLDGVLRLWPRDYSALEQKHDLPIGSIGRTAFEPTLLESVITGRITDPQWRSEVARRLVASYPRSLAQEAVAAWSMPVGTVNRDVLHMVTLARKHCQVGLVTNATDRLPSDLQDLGLTQHLDFIVNSSEVGFAKPSPGIFRHALARSGAQPEEAAFVDDTASNASAATALGIRSHQFTSIAGLDAFMRSVGLPTIDS